MDRKLLFNEAVETYERRRPHYSAQLFDDIIHYAGVAAGKSLIEIGCGTGQATLPFLNTGCSVTAVEIGTDMAGYMLHKFRDYDNLRMVNLPFEEFVCADGTFDVLYSATAFHWIPAEVGYKKAFRIIKSGGTIALFWNRAAVDRPDDALHQQIQAIYREIVPEWSDKERSSKYDEPFGQIDSAIEKAGFVGLQRKLYYNTRVFNSQEYIELLDTYSDHRALALDTRTKLYSAIKSAIEQAGDSLKVYDTMDLHMAKKP